MTLLDPTLQSGQVVEVTGFTGEDLYRERMHEMGIRVGTQLTLLGRAPFGGPLLVRFKSTFLALRSDEAQCALVKRG